MREQADWAAVFQIYVTVFVEQNGFRFIPAGDDALG